MRSAITILSPSDIFGFVRLSDSVTPSMGFPVLGSKPYIFSSFPAIRKISLSTCFPSRRTVSCSVRKEKQSAFSLRKKPLEMSSASLKELFAHVAMTCDSRAGSHNRCSKYMFSSIAPGTSTAILPRKVSTSLILSPDVPFFLVRH